MNVLGYVLGMILVVTLTGEHLSEPIRPIKPIMAAEQVPHMATAWDQQWIAAARPHFDRKRGPEGNGRLVLIGLVPLALIIWVQAWRVLRREATGRASPMDEVAAGSQNQHNPIGHALASRWGLR